MDSQTQEFSSAANESEAQFTIPSFSYCSLYRRTPNAFPMYGDQYSKNYLYFIF